MTLVLESSNVSAISALVFFRENYQSVISSGSSSGGSAIKSAYVEAPAHKFSSHHYGKELFENKFAEYVKDGPVMCVSDARFDSDRGARAIVCQVFGA